MCTVHPCTHPRQWSNGENTKRKLGQWLSSSGIHSPCDLLSRKDLTAGAMLVCEIDAPVEYFATEHGHGLCIRRQLGGEMFRAKEA